VWQVSDKVAAGVNPAARELLVTKTSGWAFHPAA